MPYILVAPNGARRGHSDHPALPVTTDETVAAARACFAAGAQGLHLHVRDADGRHSLDPGRYREVLGELRQAVPQMQVQITTEAAGIYDVSAQLACVLAVCPYWASISVREIAREPELVDRVYGACAAQGTRVQHILYDAEDVALLTRWRSQGIVRPEQADRLFVLGRYATGQVSRPEDLDRFLPTDAPWMVCAFGPQEHACLLAAAARGGDLRVGFENGLTDADGIPWADNAASVAALVTALERSRT
ncbi:3-keto-5-aminohexanoate cleavage protein [Ruegeria sediminis]|uniref:3-keto-5-aminohexanoate cleavage protein n=2 Tax=Ruegeria sediminis TaxID=2583820 RepID=A0ABY2X2W9_9RHOB|nr:3-keto-5-aminohexanoate cleavage protein [Ruegeria sediminis]